MTRYQNLADITRAVRQLSPDWHNPQRFFEERSEIEHKLKRLARDLERTAHG
jgi:hypothetical protein